ncbi:hypothetical protein LY76DRAFT_654818 [Colletotrichum caudatum]|nr:hypothetical protein LY76DRAFT_654818 [Colletotrichum caudatum]
MAVAGPIRTTVPTHGLRSKRSIHRLNQIEKIRASGIGDLVDLPQLVVCGDQSAGKSSVLEGITGIPFPRQEGLCTRFPTEIVLRHSNEPLKTKAFIRPHSGRSIEVAQTLRNYEREMKEDLSDLPIAIEEVSKLMGIRGFTDSLNDPAFASDALRIEVTGPIGLQLSVVDLPLQTRGRELPGNYSHVLLAELFHEQSGPWRQIAEDHLSGVIDKRLEKCRTHAVEELGKILVDEKRHPITYNHYYTDNIQKARGDYHKLALKEAIHPVFSSWGARLDLKNYPTDRDLLVDALQPKITVDMDQQACEEALAGLNAYYKVAMKTFIENVCKQVVERHILVPLPEIFCPTTVSQFSDDDLLRIGSEPEKEITRRQRLVKEAHGLRSSLLDLQGLST